MAPTLLPFSILKYTPNNPLFGQIGQTLSVSPQVGFSAVSYAVTAGSLPAGITLNSTTGVISGTSSILVPATKITITATLADSSQTSTDVWISIINIPDTAKNSNQNTTNSKSANQLLLEQNFLADVALVIQNNQKLGLYHGYFNVPQNASMRDLRNYLVSLSYNFTVLYPSQNDYLFVSQFGGLPDSPQFPDFTQPYPVTGNCGQDHRKILLTWSENSCPFWLYPYYYYGAYPTSC